MSKPGSMQRRRGQDCKVWPEIEVSDTRGNVKRTVDVESEPYLIKAAFIPERGSRAEVPGQQEIDLYRMIFEDGLPNVRLFSRVLWRGLYWDVAAPPEYRHGSRRTRHWSMIIRKRPEDA